MATKEQREPMRVLFFMAHAGYARNFESTLRGLAEAGHSIVLALDRDKQGEGGQADLMHALVRRYDQIQRVDAPVRKKRDALSLAAAQLRATVDYLRYLRPEFRDAHKLRRRASVHVPRWLRTFAGLPLVRTRAGIAALSMLFRLVERAIPPRPDVRSFIEGHRPDVVLVTPLLEVGSPQTEYLRAARMLGIPTALCVASWDNLTTAGLIHEIPEMVAVWNDEQRREAHELHGIPRRRVAVTGAAAYDHWFEWSPSTSREEFCATVGLRADRPFLLYLCSSGFITPAEGEFVVRWIERVRQAAPELRDVGILVRPHPTNSLAAKGDGPSPLDRLAELDNVAVWPRAPQNPTNVRARSTYFDSIHHSAAVVGINTSALIESAIVGRGVYTILAPEYRETQEGTLHFHHLLRVNGGLLTVGATYEEHARQLAEAVVAGDEAAAQARRFLQSFIRPHGLDAPATPRVVAAVEELRRTRAEALPVEAPHWVMLRPVLAAVLGAVVKLRPPTREERAAAGDVSPLATRRRPQLRPATWPVRGGRLLLLAALRVRPLRAFLYRHVRPLLLSCVVAIERSVHPERVSRHLGVVLDAAPAAKPKKEAASSKKAKLKSKEPKPEPDAATTVGLRRRLEQAAVSDGPVIAGPWLGDVAREATEWIPFLADVVAEWPALRPRLVAVSRGGVGAWYADVAADYVDASEFQEIPPRLLERFAFGGGVLAPSLASEVVARLGKRLGAPAALLSPHDLEEAGKARLLGRLDAPLPWRDEAGRNAVPSEYVAVRFGDTGALPRSPEHRDFAAATVASIARTVPVVVLADDLGFTEVLRDRVPEGSVVVLPGATAAADAVGRQLDVIARAVALVGSYDALTVAAAALGVHSTGFHPDGARPPSVDAFRRVLGSSLAVVPTADAHAAVEAVHALAQRPEAALAGGRDARRG